MPRRRLLTALAVVAVAAPAIVAYATRPPSAEPRPSGVPQPVAASIPSGALGRDMPVEVWLPSGLAADHRYPVIYLFHGRGGDETTWFAGRQGNGIGIDVIAARLIAAGELPPVVIVSARIDDSYGVDSPPGDEGYAHGPYERWIVEDLIRGVEARFPVATDPAQRFVGGLSMGGFAALHAALRRPELFAGVGALSPAVFEGSLPDRDWLYPTPQARREHDPLLLAATANVANLRIFLGYGDRDYPWIATATKRLATTLTSRGVTARPSLVEGGHEERTWRTLAPMMLLGLLTPAPKR
jgi:enterochelin esterase-like enzyme